MKKLKTYPEKCTGCGACEEMCALAWNDDAEKEKSAIRIHEDGKGGHKIAVCDQCGVCRAMCSMMSLETDDIGVVRLDQKSCTGCLICVAECLRGYMFYHDELPTPFKCVACGICVNQCPSGALEIVGGGQ
ncbi:MAG: 4Fe-4S binding protein [Oscillospiraceae bacterium]|nr:4Fe-4S binding protein [Oscillospiraceae bacterium]